VIDAEYFRTDLSRDIEATGPNASVELHLRNGRALRLRSVLDAKAGFVVLEVFLARDEGSRPPRWGEETPAGRPQPTYRASVAYEAIAAVTVSDLQVTAGPRVGFSAS
jgi:hypothetical protein